MPVPSHALRRPIGLRRELLWTLAIKLALVCAIKYSFFSQPMGHDARQQALADRLSASATPDGARPLPPPMKESTHDQRHPR
jgi:hypothetical protein